MRAERATPRFPIHVVPDLRTRAKILARVNGEPDPEELIAGLPEKQAMVYAQLTTPATVNELALRCGYEPNNVAGHLLYLCKKGLVEKFHRNVDYDCLTLYRRRA